MKSYTGNLKVKSTYQYSNQGKILLIPKCTSFNMLFSLCLLVTISDNLFYKYLTQLLLTFEFNKGWVCPKVLS